MCRMIRSSTASAVSKDQVNLNNTFFKAFKAEVYSTLFNDWSDYYSELCFGTEGKERFLSIYGWLKRWIRSCSTSTAFRMAWKWWPYFGLLSTLLLPTCNASNTYMLDRRTRNYNRFLSNSWSLQLWDIAR